MPESKPWPAPNPGAFRLFLDLPEPIEPWRGMHAADQDIWVRIDLARLAPIPGLEGNSQ